MNRGQHTGPVSAQTTSSGADKAAVWNSRCRQLMAGAGFNRAEITANSDLPLRVTCKSSRTRPEGHSRQVGSPDTSPVLKTKAESLPVLPQFARPENANRRDDAGDQLRRCDIETGVPRATAGIRNPN